MASIRRKVGSQFWYACFTTPDGRRAQRSTESTDRKLAQRLADEFEETAKKKRTEAQCRQVLSDIHEKIHGSSIASSTLEAYRKQWLDRKLGEVGKRTQSAYKHATNEFATFFAQKKTQPLQYFTAHDISLWRDFVAKKSTPTTANNLLKIIRVFFGAAWRDNLILENPAAKVRVLKTTPAQRRPFTLEELRAVLRIASNEWKGMILVAAYTGQRLKDIASLTTATVDLARGELRFLTSKTRRSQVIPLNPVLQRHLESQKQADGFAAPLFPRAYKIAVTNCDVSPLSQEFHLLLVRAGLAQPRLPKRKSKGIGRKTPRSVNPLCFHSLRHTATSWLKDAGVSESVARDIIGHESAEISRLYTHTGESAKRAAVDKLPDLLGESKTDTRPKRTIGTPRTLRIGSKIVYLKTPKPNAA